MALTSSSHSLSYFLVKLQILLSPFLRRQSAKDSHSPGLLIPNVFLMLSVLLQGQQHLTPTCLKSKLRS